MEYREIEGTDISVPAISLGTWAFGSDRWWGHQPEGDSRRVMDIALDRGVNLFDTAPAYGRGRAEEIIGRYVRDRGARSRVILATKLGLSWSGPEVFHDLSPKRMREEIEGSLSRLKTDYIDIYQVHWPDPGVPIAETAGIMSEFVRRGLVRFAGVSNYDVSGIKEFRSSCEIRFIQSPYNMFDRDIEKEVVPYCIENGLGILGYSPLCSGVLTGKFLNRCVPIPKDLCRRDHRCLRGTDRFAAGKALKDIKGVAERYNSSVARIVLRWQMMRDGISSLVTGARNEGQAEENFSSPDMNLAEEDVLELNRISDQFTGRTKGE